jgi:hypothetical protein
MSEARTIGHEFVTTPCLCVSRGEPQAKLLGGFSFGTFLWTEQRKVHTNNQFNAAL